MNLLPEGTSIWVPAILILVGIVGIVVPVIPGLLVAVLGVLLWAYETGGTTAWTFFAVCLAIYLVGVVVQFLVPGKKLRRQGVRTSTLFLAVVLGLVGMVVIPVVGFFVGFVGGIFLVEYARVSEAAEPAPVPGSAAAPLPGMAGGAVAAQEPAQARRRRGNRAQAWTRTKHALVAVVTSMGIELAAGVLIAATWVVGVLATT